MKRLFLFVGVPTLIILFWLGYPFLLSSHWIQGLFPQANWNNFGVVGDSFGALNTLFSGLALSGLAINIYLQNRHLRHIESKEKDAENKLNEQIDAIRYTALLNYYNAEIGREDWKIELQKGDGSGIPNPGTARNLTELIEKRKELVKKIEAADK